MIQSLSKFIFNKLWGWRVDVTEPVPQKCIMCIAPHTSNLDFLVGQLYAQSAGFSAGFLMKKEWFFWPLGTFFKRIGGIPVCRSKHQRMTDSLAEQALQMKRFGLCISPEGTRSANPEWKRGFYFIALKAQIPIFLYGIDYEKKKIVCTKSFVPSGDVEKEIREIKLYYKDFKGRKPELFTIGDISE